ncbi:MAG TPA: DUF805 domain-containing protein [Flavisolibacter sp.]|nr:DUF805 domain-containing protein [Flavisolibacter sp.]
MFKSPFSFEGRIRRTEYGLSVLIYVVIVITIQAILISAMSDPSGLGGAGIFAFILFLPCLFFLWAQGAKRCHDLGNSGWFQLIPFYGLWMLFADSKPGINEYGPNPKNVGNEPEFAFEENEKS